MSTIYVVKNGRPKPVEADNFDPVADPDVEALCFVLPQVDAAKREIARDQRLERDK